MVKSVTVPNCSASKSGYAKSSRILQEDMSAILDACSQDLGQLSGATLLLTGATGFIGSYLLQSLAAWNVTQRCPCRILVPVRSLARAEQRFPSLAQEPGIEWIAWVAEDKPLRSTMRHGADFVIHGASPADPADYMRRPDITLRTIVELTRQTVDYAESCGARRLLYLSSGAIYGVQPPDLAGLPEDYAGGPDCSQSRSCYAEAKRYSELLCLTSQVPSICARIYALVGPRQSLASSFAIPDFIHQGLETRRIRLRSDGRALRTYCYAVDLAISLWKLLLAGEAGQSYNVGAEGPILSIGDAARIIAQKMGGLPVEMAVPTVWEAPARYTPAIAKLKRYYTPQVDFARGIDRMLTYVQETGDRA